MEQPTNRSFLHAFIGSFVSFKDYPEYARRSPGSVFGHYCLLLVLMCSLYAFVASSWMEAHVTPTLEKMARSVPTVSIKDGRASVALEEPFVLRVENEPILVIDTTVDPQQHLDQYKTIMVLGADEMVFKQENGQIETYELEGDVEVDAQMALQWVEQVNTWFLPASFLLFFIVLFLWKPLQLLLVSGIVTLVNGSRPGMGQTLKLATYALGPAMAWSLVTFMVGCLVGYGVPGSGLVSWLLMGGLTYWSARRMHDDPFYS